MAGMAPEDTGTLGCDTHKVRRTSSYGCCLKLVGKPEKVGSGTDRMGTDRMGTGHKWKREVTSKSCLLPVDYWAPRQEGFLFSVVKRHPMIVTYTREPG